MDGVLGSILMQRYGYIPKGILGTPSSPAPSPLSQLQPQQLQAPNMAPTDVSNLQAPSLDYSKIAPDSFGGQLQPDGSTSYLGGMIHYAPKQGQTGADRLGLFGASLRDAAAQFGGHPEGANALQAEIGRTDASDQATRQQTLLQSQMARQQAALAAFTNAKTPQERQIAAVQMWGSGSDPAGLASALKVGQPELRDIPNGGSLAVIDSTTGLPISKVDGNPKQVRAIVDNASGQVSTDNGQTWNPIPNFKANAGSIAAAKRAPPKAAAGSINLPGNPASLYRGR